MLYALGGNLPREVALRRLLAPYRGVTRSGFDRQPTSALRHRLARFSA
jgi:hypothetical protein